MLQSTDARSDSASKSCRQLLFLKKPVSDLCSSFHAIFSPFRKKPVDSANSIKTTKPLLLTAKDRSVLPALWERGQSREPQQDCLGLMRDAEEGNLVLHLFKNSIAEQHISSFFTVTHIDTQSAWQGNSCLPSSSSTS